MYARLALVALAILLLLPAYPARAQVDANEPGPPIGLGFGTSSITPVNVGVPVYTRGDQMWVSDPSQYTYYVTLLYPGGNGTAAMYSVGAQAEVMLYQFLPSDPLGNWTLTWISPFQFENVTVLLTAPEGLLPTLDASGVTPNATLAMNYTVGESPAYGISTCEAVSNLPSALSVPIPSAIGSGSVAVDRNGSQISITPSIAASAPFSFWVELHQNFSYAVQNSTLVYTQDLTEASTPEIAIGDGTGNGTTVANLTQLAQIRPGLSTLWAFFRSQNAVSATTLPLLVTEGPRWVPLKDCTEYSQVSQSNFTVSYSMKSPPGLWPRILYTMYSEDGVEGFSNQTMSVLPASVELLADGTSKDLTDSLVSVVRGTNVTSSTVFGNTVYLSASAFPVSLNLTVLPGVYVQQLLGEPFTAYVLRVPAGSVSLTAVLDGARASGASVSVTYSNQTVAESSGGSPQFYLPAGAYDAGVTLGGSTKDLRFTLVDGGFDNETVIFATSATQGFPYPLLVTAIVGAGASAAVWLDVARRRRSKLRPAQT